LADAGACLGVCTNKREALAVKLLHELDMARHFGSIVGADTLPVSKPDPAPLLHVIETLGGRPADAIMVGDSVTDRDTARAAGVPVVLVSFGYTETPAAEMSPDALIHHFDDFWAAMGRIG
jgi:phosphoglycolate phosphatase